MSSQLLIWALGGCGEAIVAADTDPTDTGSSGQPTTDPTSDPTTNSNTSVDTSSTTTTTTSEPTTDTGTSSGESTDATETTVSTDSSSSSSSSDTASSSEESSTDPTDPSIFIGKVDSGNNVGDCDLWLQNCPEGDKCMPWANDGGGSWNATRCSPIDPNPAQPGDECTVEGSGVSGIDSCDLASMCWDVDPETNTGVCVAMCMGSPQNPVCADPATSCVIANEGLIILCLPMCDPLLQDCDEGDTCVGVNDEFICVPDAGGDQGQQGDPCEFLNVCDPGLACADGDLVPNCDATGCCTTYCDVSDGQANANCVAAAGAGTECVPFYADGEAPPGYEDVGLCVIPA